MPNSLKVLSAKLFLKIFEKIFGPSKKLSQRAEILVSTANLHGISSYTPLSEQYKAIKKVNPSNWDYVITVAGIYVAILKLGSLKINSISREKVTLAIIDNLNKWNTSGLDALEDCKTVFSKEYERLESIDSYREDSRFIVADALGVWIFLNLFQEMPRLHEDYNLSRALGIMSINNFTSWWGN
jgi:hypothetical protein